MTPPKKGNTMENIAMLQFLTDKYHEMESETDKAQVSILYWTVMDYTLHGISNVALNDNDILTSPILN